MDTDITIIGAGVIGLAIASALADSKLSMYVLEKNESHGRGISSRNSEVIHAGIYYPQGSLKAGLCVEGREMLYETCMKNNIPHNKIGKLIIATSDHELDKIEHLADSAKRNGVSVSLLGQAETHEMEPNIKAAGALYSPDTGIISAHALMNYYLRSAKMRGAEIVYKTKVEGIEKLSTGYKISTSDSGGDCFEFVTERVINAAGLQSDTIAKMVGKDYELHYCKGDYFSIQNVKKGMVNRLVYPVPEENHVGLGVHLTLDLSGRMKLGPDATYIERVEDYKVNAGKIDTFFHAAARYLPFLNKEDIVPDMSGIRPKLQGVGEGFSDFVISEDLPGFINLIGIESPGLTAAPAIARYVKNLFNGVSSNS
ncbi:L-2-hydroxyglutarate oxidase LhgO [bacterium BMS3Abin07]|nr:L-2-hydroxyglutarate oxidase LhgO [bacterium BMS3Abin07]HDO21604.1 NAD(P)/FAD-dependent oxidoreductase [Nitrospirota bacterium]HDZ88547.1 NAD(P)/FAD-dependent oxidoreductase [Nitrospirota bacterium]